jgi:hypothetical protein
MQKEKEGNEKVKIKGGGGPDDGDSKHLWNVGQPVPDNRAQQYKTWSFLEEN